MERIINQGWECPKCGRVYSPTTPMCFHCVPVNGMTISTTGTGGINIQSVPTSAVIPSEDERQRQESERVVNKGCRQS